MNKSALRATLSDLNFGERVAEKETEPLRTYFVKTDQWNKLFEGKIDILYGAKGVGKSALYALLFANQPELQKRRILLVAAEKPQGATAFKKLVVDPPASEREFIGLWKLYFASLLHSKLVERGIKNAPLIELEELLASAKLVKGRLSLAVLLKRALRYARATFRLPQSVEGGVQLEPNSGMPSGVNGKITFAEPDEEDEQFRSLDDLLELANSGAIAKSW